MTKIVFAGFGGQGILMLGQIVATIAMNKGKQVVWMPTYGAEMRGGAANCSVIISDKVIGNPLAMSDVDILCLMSKPSLDKFLPVLKPGGVAIVNCSLITESLPRNDITIVSVDATNIAIEMGNLKVSNIVMLAGFLQSTELFTLEDIKAVLEQKFNKKNPKLVSLNIEAIERGMHE